MTKLVTTSHTSGILTVTLNRPEKRNALCAALITEMAAAFTLWTDREDLVLAILTGAGDKAFASGGDLDELSSMRTEQQAVAFAREVRGALDTIRRFSVPVVAVLNGDAFGGGAELAMACDLRIAAAHARIGFLQGRLNIATAWGGGTDLFQLLGPSRALDVLCTARMFDASQALAIGLVDAVAPADLEIAKFAASHVESYAGRKPQVMRAFKSLAILYRSGASASDKADSEGAAFARTWVHEDHWAALNAMAGRGR